MKTQFAFACFWLLSCSVSNSAEFCTPDSKELPCALADIPRSSIRVLRAAHEVRLEGHDPFVEHEIAFTDTREVELRSAILKLGWVGTLGFWPGAAAASQTAVSEAMQYQLNGKTGAIETFVMRDGEAIDRVSSTGTLIRGLSPQSGRNDQLDSPGPAAPKQPLKFDLLMYPWACKYSTPTEGSRSVIFLQASPPALTSIPKGIIVWQLGETKVNGTWVTVLSESVNKFAKLNVGAVRGPDRNDGLKEIGGELFAGFFKIFVGNKLSEFFNATHGNAFEDAAVVLGHRLQEIRSRQIQLPDPNDIPGGCR